MNMKINQDRQFVILNQDLNQEVVKQIGVDWAYIIDIITILKENNEFNIREFRYKLWKSSQMYNRIKKRLLDKNIIKKSEYAYYFNPFIAYHPQWVEDDIIMLFAK